MQTAEVIVFGILLNVTAGLGAFGFGWLDDRIGAKPTILFALVGVLAFGIPMLVIESKLWFYILGAMIGLFFGPAQSASRSLMARLVPEGKENEMFGLYAFSGKSTAFLGPWMFALMTTMAGHRWGMASVMPFLVIGALILLTVKTEKVDPDTIL
jgi:UMF1 family MFS transporter